MISDKFAFEAVQEAYSLGQQELLAKIEGELPPPKPRLANMLGGDELFELAGMDGIVGFNSCLNQIKDIIKRNKK